MRARLVGLGAAALFPAILFACGLDDSVVLQSGASGADGGGGTDATISSDGGVIDGSGPTSDGAATNEGGEPPNPPVFYVFATTETELYSFDVISGKLSDLGTLANCGSPTNFADLALDSAGQLWLLKETDAFYKVDRSGNCSVRTVLNSNPGPNDGPVIDKFAAKNTANPFLVGLNGTNNDYYAIDTSVAANGTLTKLNTDLFTDDTQPGAMQYGVYDLACRSNGTCWTALAQGCNPGVGSSCLYTFKADGSAVATAVGAIGVQPAGLAYALGRLYSFGVNGKITSIDLSVTPVVAQTVAPTGAPLPPTWSGAGSASNND